MFSFVSLAMAYHNEHIYGAVLVVNLCGFQGWFMVFSFSFFTIMVCGYECLLFH